MHGIALRRHEELNDFMYRDTKKRNTKKPWGPDDTYYYIVAVLTVSAGQTCFDYDLYYRWTMDGRAIAFSSLLLDSFRVER